MIDMVTNNELPASLLEVMRYRSQTGSESVAYIFRAEGEPDVSITFAELERRAQAIAARLRTFCQPGDRVLLLYPAGIDFITSFFGCVYAGVLAVPTCYPKPKRPMPRLAAIARDSGAQIVLTNSKTLNLVRTARSDETLAALSWIASDKISDDEADQWICPEIHSDDLLFLQYTSGSTNDPKGVMVTNGNLIHNLESIRQGFQVDIDVKDEKGKGVFWLPAYHDMGLIGGVLSSMFVGGQSILMSPTDFLRRPVRWLKAISESGAQISGAPNFAYELCVQKTTKEQCADLDLSSWRLGFCGAEPIRPETLENFIETFAPYGFSADAFYPCYGLAESTLLSAGGDGPSRPTFKIFRREALAENRVEDAHGGDAQDALTLVSCGTARWDQKIEIVDPETRRRCSSNKIGEIWMQGPSIAAGYWNRPEETVTSFQARVADTNEGPFLRTGDLGFVRSGELFVTGRIKDVIIIRGRNLYPQDIERSVASAHPALRLDAGAAFALSINGEEQLGIIHEVERSFRREDLTEVAQLVRRVVLEDHDIDPQVIVLIRHASLSMTTSGKVQRSLCRQQYVDGQLRVEYEWVNKNRQPKSIGHSSPPVVETEALVASVTISSGAAAIDSAVPRGTSLPVRGNGHEINVLETATEQSTNGHSKSQPQNKLKRLEISDHPMTADEMDRLTERIEVWLMDWLVNRANVVQSEIRRDKPFADYGLDSLTAVEMSQDIEDWLGIQVTATVAWNYPTSATMARHLADELAGVSSDETSQHPTAPHLESEDDFEGILTDIESLSDAEVERLLAEQQALKKGNFHG